MPPSYHDLHVTAPGVPRRPIFNLPYGLEVTCSRARGWVLWQQAWYGCPEKVLAGEYEGPDSWLVLDVAGFVICDSRARPPEDE